MRDTEGDFATVFAEEPHPTANRATTTRSDPVILAEVPWGSCVIFNFVCLSCERAQEELKTPRFSSSDVPRISCADLRLTCVFPLEPELSLGGYAGRERHDASVVSHRVDVIAAWTTDEQICIGRIAEIRAIEISQAKIGEVRI